MPQKRVIDIQFPLGGLHRRSGFQQQPPFTTPDCLNFRPTDTIRHRQRGGSRPGLGKSHYTQLGSGSPIRLLDAITVTQQNGLKFWVDNFDEAQVSTTTLGGSWSGLDGAATTINTFPDETPGSIVYNNSGSALHAGLSDLDVSQDYVIELFIAPWAGQHWGNYRIYLRTTGDNPFDDGVVVELVMQDSSGTFSGSLKRYSAAAIAESYLFTIGQTGSPQAGWFRVIVSGNNVTVTWLENTVLASTTIGAAAGTQFGFGMACTQATGYCLTDAFRIQYKTTDNNQAYRRLLVASSNGVFYRENHLNTLESVSSSVTLASNRQLLAAERFQKLYIADNDNPRTTGTDGVIAAGVLDAASVSNWTTKGIVAADDVAVITDVQGASGGFVAGTYNFTTIHATNGLTLTGVTGSCTTCTFRIERAPKIYDPGANTLTRYSATSGKGDVPTGCPLVCNYRDRIVFAGPPVAPHAWFMSRQGDPLDWDYGASSTDIGRAVAGVNTEAGFLGDPIRALIPGGDEWLIFGCDNSMAVLRNDPAADGRIDYLSRTIGIVDAKAWCRGPSNEIIFMSRDGLYAMPNGGGIPTSISRERLPEELLRLDNQNYTVQLQYDVQDRGIHIFLTPKVTTEHRHYWFDYETKGFWRVSLPVTMDPTTSMYFASTCATDTAVLLGCKDGYIRRFSDYQWRDEATAFTSYVTLGPIRAGDSYNDGMIDEVIGKLPYSSGPLTWQLFIGDTSEQAYRSTLVATDGFSLEGLNYKSRPRRRCNSFYLKILKSTYAVAVGDITVTTQKLGGQRL